MDRSYFTILQGILSETRYDHSLRVSAVAAELAELYQADREKASLAGLLHDCAKNLPHAELLRLAKQNGVPVSVVEETKPSLLHAPVGALIAKDRFGVLDGEILQAIALHTVGSENMTLLDKIVFIADKTEPGRDSDDLAELNQIAKQDLDLALLHYFNAAIIEAIHEGELIHPRAVLARNKINILRLQAGNNSHE